MGALRHKGLTKGLGGEFRKTRSWLTYIWGEWKKTAMGGRKKYWEFTQQEGPGGPPEQGKINGIKVRNGPMEATKDDC